VQKTLKEQYPDAQTTIERTDEVNGVKVYDVKVTTKQGDSTARVTEYGDFLTFGVPVESTGVRNLLASNVQGLFKTQPSNIDRFKVTNYSVDLPGPKGKSVRAVFDAVGRLKDVYNADEIARESGKNARGEAVTGEQADRAKQYVMKYDPKAQIEGVYKDTE